MPPTGSRVSTSQGTLRPHGAHGVSLQDSNNMRSAGRPSRAHEPKVMQAAAGLVRACHSSVGGWVVHYESESCRHTHARPALTEYSVPREIPLDCPLWPKLPAPHRVQGAGAHLRQGRPHVSRAPPPPRFRDGPTKNDPFPVALYVLGPWMLRQRTASVCPYQFQHQTPSHHRQPSTLHRAHLPVAASTDPRPPRPSIFCPVHNPLHPGRCLCPPPLIGQHCPH